MTSRIASQIPYLRVQRSFPEESQPLSVELDKTYIDIANAVNQRGIGTFSSDITFATGETWFVQPNGRRQQGFRKVYEITGAGSTNHGINFNNISAIVRLWGTFTDGTNWYTLPYVDVVAANNQISLTLSPTQIVITAGGGAPPTITSGFVVVEWLAQA